MRRVLQFVVVRLLEISILFFVGPLVVAGCGAGNVYRAIRASLVAVAGRMVDCRKHKGNAGDQIPPASGGNLDRLVGT